MKPQIINIINFIRAVDPREPGLDLIEPVKNQLELLEKYKLQGTFLIQYDAMLKPEFVDLLKKPSNRKHEIGAWFEVVQPMVEKAGLKWRGRPGFAWDWHADVGFLIGYTPKEREILSDTFMEGFMNTFGYYPKSVGSWLIDAYTLDYLERKYGITASCNCRDQWGTDGYTLWGGYYNQAYYPSKKNVFCPAQTEENQINIPVFRMLGSDPIYQYDAGLITGDVFSSSPAQPVITLEPVYPVGGGSEEWVKWFLSEIFNGKCLSFGYTQVGQENSFGWPSMGKGLSMQLKLVSEYLAQGKIRVETLSDSAQWFRQNFKVTPASSIAAVSDWKKEGHRSIWYSSRNYRLNLYQEFGQLWVRDMHVFNEKYEERYLKNKCDISSFHYDNLPVMDGNRWSHGRTRAGIYPVIFGENGTITSLEVLEPEVTDMGGGLLRISWEMVQGGEFEVLCREESIDVYCNGEIAGRWGLKMAWKADKGLPITNVTNNKLEYLFNGFNYSVNFSNTSLNGKIDEGSIVIRSQENKITINWED
ncbi:hypothetical protein [Anaerocolumna sp. MB42-C2]|uniref:hypothetical protein n=1 Tax=Anaerocolumna sp. MB42-C2 TaxID=3070997 RepID=UPI0027DF57B1|nr:hypothetical protein [Anaerocolumna sp. MB42-C2]WMJ85845.1 hypothetical protein RBU59_17460 [Anaerocolumna sp. MB42-C2]